MTVPQAVQDDTDAADDIDDYDAIEIQTDSDSSLDMYAHAGTWSEDEDGNLVRAVL